MGPTLDRQGGISLRGHHLVCLHFFSGQGYSREFIAALRGLVESARAGAAVEAVEGADQVCLMCPHLREGRCESEEGAEEEIRRMDSAALALLGLAPGDVTDWARLEKRLAAALPLWKERFCGDCPWRAACECSAWWLRQEQG